MSKPFVYVTRLLPEDQLAKLKETANVEMWEKEEEPCPRKVLLEKAREADGLLTMLSDKIDQELLEQAENLKVIANLAVGYDNIDVKYAASKKITVCNTPDVLTDTTADLAFALLMASARRIAKAADYIKEGKWKGWGPLQMAGMDIHGKTLGIVGMGKIGTAVAKRGTGFDMKILYHNRSRNKAAEEAHGAKHASFDEVLEQSDFVVCLTPLTEETKEMFTYEAFKKMKRKAIFVNASRGAVVKEDDLKRAIEDGLIAGAGLDVFASEPIQPDHPLLGLRQVTALPHIGSSSEETRLKMMELCSRNIAAVLKGKQPETPVT
ncbi:D-glycerate dehydrogenase [Metabacillus sp. GX 13764]|uniref:2-hydroxyacid dehydrogenase n=1 Tax=Metabacillus kandeliae TaxID=2900151 RepID=UPI001E30588F|nr:D-glycerate dehydrogenase [Metabacillus kandeliae]